MRSDQEAIKTYPTRTYEVWRLFPDGSLIDREERHTIEPPDSDGNVHFSGDPSGDAEDRFFVKIPFAALVEYVKLHRK